MFSHSKIACFESCPRQYAFRYVDKLPVDTEGIEAFLGQRVHEALENLYRMVRGTRVLTEAELLADYEARWQREWHDKVRIVRKEFGADHHRELGRQMLSRYHRRYAPFNQAIIIATEARIQIDLDAEGKTQVQGYVDRIDKVADGRWEIHDYKTEGSLATQADKDADRQLALYEIGLRRMHPEIREVALVWHYLRFDEEIRSARTPGQLEALLAEIAGKIKAVEAAELNGDFPPHESALCDWCAFRAHCPLFRHGEALSAPPPPASALDARKIVNRLGEIKEHKSGLDHEIKALEAEAESLKRELITLAKSHGWLRVSGDRYEATLKDRSDWKIPGTAECELHDELLVRLQASSYWNAVSGLSRANLQKLLEEDPAVRTLLRGLVHQQHETTVSLRKGQVAGDEG
jgi:putative RecB family exonuclease